jgi:hypothetical protein
MTTKKPNLILTFAHGYSWTDLSVFFNSLRKTGFTGDVVVFASRLSEATINALEERGVIVKRVHLPLFKLRNIFLLAGWWPWKLLLRMLPNFKSKRAFSKIVFNIMCARFAHFHQYLEDNLDSYGHVLTTDIRDVCFQADPFSVSQHLPIVSFLENLRIADGVNAQWLLEAYGKQLDRSILSETVTCAGVTLGTATAMLDYLTKMLHHLFKVDLMVPVAGVDQAVHNFLFHRQQLADSVRMPNGNPICFTMGDGEPYQLNDRGEVLAHDGSPVSILHQYDRHAELKKAKYERDYEC